MVLGIEASRKYWYRKYHKMIYQVNKPFHPSTNPEILVKIGSLDFEKRARKSTI